MSKTEKSTEAKAPEAAKAPEVKAVASMVIDAATGLPFWPRTGKTPIVITKPIPELGASLSRPGSAGGDVMGFPPNIAALLIKQGAGKLTAEAAAFVKA